MEREEEGEEVRWKEVQKCRGRWLGWTERAILICRGRAVGGGVESLGSASTVKDGGLGSGMVGAGERRSGALWGHHRTMD